MMRLFLAINFSDLVKNQIDDLIDSFKPSVKQGSFVRMNNLHLTLEFLGDIEEEKVTQITEALNEIEAEKFSLKLRDIGYFKTRKGRLSWLAPEFNETLIHLQREIHQKLIERDFTLDTREFFPHITIGRQIKLKEKLNSSQIEKRLKQIEIQVESLDLMASKMVDGKLTYITITSRKLT